MQNDVKEVPVSEEQPTVEEVTETVPESTEVAQPGAKTDSALLLQSLKEEREKRRLAEEEKMRMEAELLALKTQPEAEVFSDEGKAIMAEVAKIKSQLMTREEKELLAVVQTKFPQIKDKQAEFEQFRRDNPGMKLETQAKAFIVENDLLEVPQVRKGLEKASGGGRVPAQTGLSQEDIQKIQIENPRKFRDMLKSGQIKP